MPNGRPRDALSSDIAAGLPALSPEVDQLAAQVARLLSLDEVERFWSDLHNRVLASESFLLWLHDTEPNDLAELDPSCVANLAAYSPTCESSFLGGLEAEGGRSRRSIRTEGVMRMRGLE